MRRQSGQDHVYLGRLLRDSRAVAGRSSLRWPAYRAKAQAMRGRQAGEEHDMADPLADLSNKGVSIWLDDLSRQRLVSGSLADLAANYHVVGVTTNPTIFAKAITGSDSYTDQIRDLRARGVDTAEALRTMTAFDVRWACDVLRPVYDATDGVDGRVSIEVDPRLAHDTEATIAEARALWWLVDRPNLFIKIPAAPQGPPRHRGVPGRGDQYQHHTDLLPCPLRPGHRGLPRRPGAGSAGWPGLGVD